MKEIKEEWRTPQYVCKNGRVVKFPNSVVSNTGKLVHLKHRGSDKQVEAPVRKDIDGYLHVSLSSRSFMLHRIVASTFLPCPDPSFEVHHIDECKENCAVNNLEWLSHADHVAKTKDVYEKAAVLRINHPSLSKKVKVTFLDDNHSEIYPSSHEAERVLGLPKRYISHCICDVIRNGYCKALNVLFEYL